MKLKTPSRAMAAIRLFATAKVFERTWPLYLRYWGVWAGIVIPFFFPVFCLSLLYENNLPFAKPEWAIVPSDARIVLTGMLGAIAFVAFFLSLIALELGIEDLVKKERCCVSSVYRRAFAFLAEYVRIKLETAVRILVGLVPFILPGILAALKYSFAGMAYIYDGKTGKDAFDRSAALVKAAKGPYAVFWVGIVTWMCLSIYVLRSFFDFIISRLLGHELVIAAWAVKMLMPLFIGFIIVFPIIAGYHFYYWVSEASEASLANQLTKNNGERTV